MKIASLVMAALLMATVGVAQAAPSAMAQKYRGVLTREAHMVLGLNAPVSAFAAQIEQESAWRPGITAWDNGRGLAQFMDGTSSQISKLYPEIGKPAPYNPLWAIPALVRYDEWIFGKVKGKNDCERWGATFKGYNAGLGYVQRAQKRATQPQTWFGSTELINPGQSAKNFEYSRMYPRWILFKRQPTYQGWGGYLCEGVK